MTFDTLGSAVSVLVGIVDVVSVSVGLLPNSEIVGTTSEVGEDINTKALVGVIVREGFEKGA